MRTPFAELAHHVFALVPRPNFNQGRCREANALGVRSAYPRPFVPTAVRLKGLHFRNHPTSNYPLRWLFFQCQRFRRSRCSTERRGDKRSAEADLIASIAPMRTRRTCVRLPSYPPYKKARFQRAALEPFGLSFSPIFLQTKKDRATGGRRSRREVGKHVKPKF